MADFVLVHGSTQNSTCWARVQPGLRSYGHRVVTPELPKGASGWRLEDYARVIADSIPSPDAVVVGHSFAGILLRLVARLRRCGSLVFLAAAIPEPGKSLEDQLRADPSMLSAAWLAAGPRWREASQRRQVADEFLFHDCDPETRAWALGTLDHLDTGPLVSEALPSEAGPTRPVASIVATDDRTLSPAWSRRITREVLGVEPFEIRSGHCPHVSRPGAVAEMLHDWAARAASPGRPP